MANKGIKGFTTLLSSLKLLCLFMWYVLIKHNMKETQENREVISKPYLKLQVILQFLMLDVM